MPPLSAREEPPSSLDRGLVSTDRNSVADAKPPTPLGCEWRKTDDGWNLWRYWSEKDVNGEKIKRSQYAGYLSNEVWGKMRHLDYETFVSIIGQRLRRYGSRTPLIDRTFSIEDQPTGEEKRSSREDEHLDPVQITTGSTSEEKANDGQTDLQDRIGGRDHSVSGGSAARDDRRESLNETTETEITTVGILGSDHSGDPLDPGSGRSLLDEPASPDRTEPSAEVVGGESEREMSKSLVTSPENVSNKSLVTSEPKTISQVTSDLLKVKATKSTRKQKVRSIAEYKEKKEKRERRRRVSNDPDKPATPPSHQWRRVGNAWVLWRVTYSYLHGKQKKQFKFVNGSYLTIESVQEGKKKANEQRRKNISGSIFD